MNKPMVSDSSGIKRGKEVHWSLYICIYIYIYIESCYFSLGCCNKIGVAYKQKTFFPHCPGGWVPAWAGSGEGPLPGCRWPFSSCSLAWHGGEG